MIMILTLVNFNNTESQLKLSVQNHAGLYTAYSMHIPAV